MARLSLSLYAMHLSTAAMYIGCVLERAAAQDYIVNEQSGYHFNQLGAPAQPQTITATCPWDELNLQRWEDPGSWPAGMAPSAGNDVTLPQNAHFLLSTSTSIGKLIIPVTSSLVFANTNLELVTTGVQVLGSLQAGSINCQVTSEITITLAGTRRLGEDAYYKGIVVEETGTIDMHGVRYRVTWTRLAKNSAAQDSEIILQDCVDDWPVGGEIVVTTTEFKNSREHNFNEVSILQGAECFDVTMDGNMTNHVPKASGELITWITKTSFSIATLRMPALTKLLWTFVACSHGKETPRVSTRIILQVEVSSPLER
jgi:hypothetical protein